jgi:acetyl-CoA C-acetyltransferase
VTLDPRTPVIVGAGQVLRREDRDEAAVEPAAMIADALRLAAEDSGAGDALLARADSVRCVPVIGWHYADLAALVASDVRARPRETVQSARIGGDGPLVLANETAADIAAGDADLVLLGGAEAGAYLRAAALSGCTPAWRTQDEQLPPPRTLGAERSPLTERELAVGLAPPVCMYALFENAVRARAGTTPAAHTETIARLWSRFSEVGSRNPSAWISRPYAPEEIALPTPANRLVSTPYTKLLTANIQVNMASGLVLASARAAQAAGVPRERWVFLHAGAHAEDVWHVGERAELASSPAVRALGRAVFEHCGTTVDDVAHIDLYSCFPSAVQIAARELGLDPEDERRALTVTGGLTFAGGPGNNYASHALATLVRRLREDPSARGLATAVGWYLTKHALSICSAEPPRARFQNFTPKPPEACAPGGGMEIAPPATLETYTVTYGRDGAPEAAIVSARDARGARAFARSGDEQIIGALLTGDPLGEEIELARDERGLSVVSV